MRVVEIITQSSRLHVTVQTATVPSKPVDEDSRKTVQNAVRNSSARCKDAMSCTSPAEQKNKRPRTAPLSRPLGGKNANAVPHQVCSFVKSESIPRGNEGRLQGCGWVAASNRANRRQPV
jgi:hypothetical protein